MPRLDGLKVYLDEMPGKARFSNLDDIERVAIRRANGWGIRLKNPKRLLERISRPVVRGETLCSIHFVGVHGRGRRATAESALDRD